MYILDMIFSFFKKTKQKQKQSWSQRMSGKADEDFKTHLKFLNNPDKRN